MGLYCVKITSVSTIKMQYKIHQMINRVAKKTSIKCMDIVIVGDTCNIRFNVFHNLRKG